jgi:radial spoke head protein 3
MLSEKFSYSSQPHAAPVKSRKQKYRNEDEPEDNGHLNMMNDPRIVRGNTHSAKVMTQSLKSDQEYTQKSNAQSMKRDRKRYTPSNNRAGTPPPVDGRVHMDIQTENFLEELTDKAIEIDQETQTQAFMDRPASPLFVATKTGKDTSTQIDNGDLFDFDLEVEPLLEVLVGKTIHVSMLELMQEEELEAIRREQEQFEDIRNVELAEVQRLEAEARRKAQEKDRRVAQERQRVADRTVLEEKIAARAYSNQYLATLHEGVMNDLFDEGFFYDPVKKEIEEVFMVNLINDLRSSVDSYQVSKNLVEELLVEAGSKAKSLMARGEKARAHQRSEEAKALEAAAAAKKAADEAAALAAAKATEEEE